MDHIDVSKLPKYAQHHIAALQNRIAEQSEHIERIDAAKAEQAELKLNQAENASATPSFDTDVFDKVNRRVNQYGTVYNCRLAEGLERLNVAIAAKALGVTLNGRNSDPRIDRNDRTWIDFYANETMEDLV